MYSAWKKIDAEKSRGSIRESDDSSICCMLVDADSPSSTL